MLTTIKTYSQIILLSMGQNNYHAPHSLLFQRFFYFLFLPFQVILLLIQIDNIPIESFLHVDDLLIAVIIGFVIGLIATGIMRFARIQSTVSLTHTSGGLTTHTSSSDRTHGGGGGKF